MLPSRLFATRPCLLRATAGVFDPVVLTVGSFHAGMAHNVIPDEAAFEATLRSFSAAQVRRWARPATKISASMATTSTSSAADTVRCSSGKSCHVSLLMSVCSSSDPVAA